MLKKSPDIVEACRLILVGVTAVIVIIIVLGCFIAVVGLSILVVVFYIVERVHNHAF